MALRPLLFSALLLATVAGGAQDAPAPAQAPALYSMDVTRQDVTVVLKEFARRTGAPLTILDLPTQLVSFSFKDLSFEKALAQILVAGSLEMRKVDEGYVVGMPVDLKLRFPQPGEKDLDATYRCRRVGAQSLAATISALLPDVKVSIGPLFLSPSLGSGNGATSDSQIRTLDATDISFRTHDVVFSGPAEQVRRALTLAQKFDRPRKQVRINIKVITVESTSTDELGISWQPSLGLTATEQPTPNGLNQNMVDGIRLGRFAHTPLVVSSTLNALEMRGKSKTLSNPTLMLLDGERSFILSGQKLYYPVYKGKDNNGLALYDVGEIKVGVYLQVGVQIGLDNDMILSLYPQVTSLNGFDLVNGGKYPQIFTSEEQTTVRASSGEVLVLGGMLLNNSASDKDGLPFLSRIPVLGKIFSTSTKTSAKSELMLILTPELVEETVPKPDVTVKVSVGGGAGRVGSEPTPALGTPSTCLPTLKEQVVRLG